MSDEEFFARIVYWLNTITNTIKVLVSPSCLIVGTHKDQCSEERLQNISEKVKKLESQFRCIRGFVMINLKDDTMDNLVDNLFTISKKAALGTKKVPFLNYNLEKVLDYHQKLLKERDSIIGEEKIENISSTSLNEEEFKEILSLQNVKRISSFVSHQNQNIESNLIFLHDMGSLLYYEDELLKDIVILDLSWLASRMSDLISFKNK